MEDKTFIDLKIRIWFKMNNIKKNGSMSKGDFQEIADIFKREYKLTDKQYSALNKWLCDGWEVLVQKGQELTTSGKPGGLTPEIAPLVFDIVDTLNNGGAITEDQYAKAFEQLVEINGSLFQTTFEGMVSTFFDVYDTDSDGLISVDDMIRGLQCLGMQQDEAAKMMFSKMDKEKTGKVCKSVYVAEWVEFMLGNKRDAAIASVMCRH